MTVRYVRLTLPEPTCPLGYTSEDLAEIFSTEEKLQAFRTWMVGQTGEICNGVRYSYELKKYEPDECNSAPHGFITYVWDVRRYLEGGPPSD